MEASGLTFGAISLASLFKTALEAWDFIDAGRAHAENFGYFQTRLDTQRALFLIWAKKFGFFSPEGYNTALDSPERCCQIRNTLSYIELIFSNTDELVRRYGIEFDNPATSANKLEAVPSQGETSSAIFRGKYIRFRTAFRELPNSTSLTVFQDGLKQNQDNTPFSKKVKWSIRDETKADDLISRLCDLVEDLNKLTRDIEATKTGEQLAAEMVSEIGEASLVAIKDSCNDGESIIASAASIRLRAIECGTLATSSISGETFATAQTHQSPRVRYVASSTNISDSAHGVEQTAAGHLDIGMLEVENCKARTRLVTEWDLAGRDPNGSLPSSQSTQGLTRSIPRKNFSRLFKEVKRFESTSWFTLSPISETCIDKFLATVRGPSGTPYEGGIFHIRLDVPDEYPREPPAVWFLTRILHPNIDAHGAICVDILEEYWNPVTNITTLLVSMVLLLNDPNWENPVERFLPSDWCRDKEEFQRRARSWTLKYATGQILYPGERDDGYYNVSEVAEAEHLEDVDADETE